MIKFWLEKDKCTGCAACANICPKHAIDMKKDANGFVYPKIQDSCIECGKCKRICKNRLLKQNNNLQLPLTYAAWSSDNSIRFNSTSGGVFSELATEILSHNGIAVGASYREDNLVEHICIDKGLFLEKIRQSKYIQSEINNIYVEIKSYLSENRKVLFCGSPCQVAGLYAFLEKNYENLYTIDFICRGVNSPKAYQSWLDELEEKAHSKVKKVWFKYKINGWKKSPKCTRIDFEDGHHIIQDQDTNLFMSGYLGPNLYIRPCCGNCNFKTVPRQGDVTLADFWGLMPKLDDDNGASIILINNSRGKALFEEAKKHMTVYKREFEEILAGNVCFNSSVIINPASENFLQSLDNQKFSKAIKRFIKISWKQHIKKVIKKIITITCKENNKKVIKVDKY